MTEQLLRLPEKPGTVIAIGEWWLVRLRPYEGAPSAWEMLPLPSKELTEHAERNGVKAQCVYGDDWVLAEAEQEGGYLVISDPRDEPSGIQYFKPVPARTTEPPNHCPECGAWGTVETHLRGCSRDPAREPERPIWDGMGYPPIGSRVQIQRPSGKVVGGVVLEHTAREGGSAVRVAWDPVGAVGVPRLLDIEPEEQQ